MKYCKKCGKHCIVGSESWPTAAVEFKNGKIKVTGDTGFRFVQHQYKCSYCGYTRRFKKLVFIVPRWLVALSQKNK